MRAHLTVRTLGLAVAALVLVGCNIIPLSPSLSLTVQTTPYTTSTITVPYSYATLSTSSSDGTAECNYVLSKWFSQDGGYSQIDNNQMTMAKSGTLTFDLPTLLNAPAGSSTLDGLYTLSFTVYTGQYDQNGRPIAVPYLQVTKNFSVHTYTGPEIFTVSPSILNVNNGPQSMSVSGLAFTPTTSLATLPASSLLTGSTYVGTDSMTAVIDPTTLSAGSILSIYATDGSGAVSPVYDIPIVSNVTITSVTPTGDSMRNSQVPIYIYGSYLGAWTTATVTDSAGTTVKLQNTYTSGSYLFGDANLTSLVAGPATITVQNPDGTSATYPFTVYN